MLVKQPHWHRHLDHTIMTRETGRTPHAYELRCADCDKHIQWLTVRDYLRINMYILKGDPNVNHFRQWTK